MNLGVLNRAVCPAKTCSVLLIAAARCRGGGTSRAPQQAQPLPSSCTQRIPCYQVPKEQLSMNWLKGRKINVFLPVCKCEAGIEAPPNAAPAIRPLQESQGTSFPNNWRKRRKKKNPNVIFLSPGIFCPGEPRGCWLLVAPLG